MQIAQKNKRRRLRKDLISIKIPDLTVAPVKKTEQNQISYNNKKSGT